MSYPHRPVGATYGPAAARPGWTVRKSCPDTPVLETAPTVPMRRYEVMALGPDGSMIDDIRTAPATPLFESAVAAIAHGALVATEQGPVAIEDLHPGIKVVTRGNGLQTLLWRGATTLLPRAGHEGGHCLYRIPMDSFGPQRPMPDLVLGPHARLLHRSPALRGLVGSDTALVPLAAFEDGNSLVRVAPVSAVRVFHLGFANHEILSVNGIEIESFHPVPEAAARMSHEDLTRFLALFPHITGLGGFGPLRLPRISPEACEMLAA